MPETTYTTRVYKYGAVPLGPFPEEGIDSLWKANRLWNNLVQIHNEHSVIYDQARRDEDEEYNIISAELEEIEDKIKKAFDEKRTARMKARTRSSTHPLISAANAKIDVLFTERGKLWDDIKAPRKRADALIDKKALNSDFNIAVRDAQRTKNTDDLDASTANEVARNFREARSKIFTSPKSRLRFHRFDGSGYRFYRFRDQRDRTIKVDGVSFGFFTPRNPGDDRAFLLEPSTSRRGVPRLQLKIKVAGGNSEASKVYATFDVVMHRPIPERAQINNAKLMRNRVGDKFKYTVNFSVRVPQATTIDEGIEAIGVDIGFRRLAGGSIRAAVIGGTKKGFGFEEVTVSKKIMDRIEHIEAIQTTMDESATELGKGIKPLLEKGAVLDEDHPKHRFIKAIANAPSNVTLSLEQAYKLGSWVKSDPGNLPKKVEEAAIEWWRHHSRMYLEMHNLRKKTLAWRKETYRILAAKLVMHGYPIAVEQISLSVFAEVKDKDNELPDQARSQRFLVSNSELIGAIKNAAKREGVPVFEVAARNTSKTCSACGVVNAKLKAEMNWQCSDCGAEHDRDENAALNIALLGQKKMAQMIGKKAKAA